MNNLVERLRAVANAGRGPDADATSQVIAKAFDEAATEIERLQSELTKMREALEYETTTANALQTRAACNEWANLHAVASANLELIGRLRSALSPKGDAR